MEGVIMVIRIGIIMVTPRIITIQGIIHASQVALLGVLAFQDRMEDMDLIMGIINYFLSKI